MKGKRLTVLFSATLFLSAALSFGIQPMIGKMVLPLLGGVPAGPEHLHGVFAGMTPASGLRLCTLVRALGEFALPRPRASGSDAASRPGPSHRYFATDGRFGAV